MKKVAYTTHLPAIVRADTWTEPGRSTLTGLLWPDPRRYSRATVSTSAPGGDRNLRKSPVRRDHRAQKAIRASKRPNYFTAMIHMDHTSRQTKSNAHPTP